MCRCQRYNNYLVNGLNPEVLVARIKCDLIRLGEVCSEMNCSFQNNPLQTIFLYEQQCVNSWTHLTDSCRVDQTNEGEPLLNL